MHVVDTLAWKVYLTTYGAKQILDNFNRHFKSRIWIFKEVQKQILLVFENLLLYLLLNLLRQLLEEIIVLYSIKVKVILNLH